MVFFLRQSGMRNYRLGDPPIVRKVIRQDDYFVCTLCRRSYPNEIDAVGCLNNCLQHVLAMPWLIEERRGLQTIYKCRLCARKHLSEKLGKRCARGCRSRLTGLHESHLELFHLKVEDLPISKFVFAAKPQLVAANVVAKSPFSSGGTMKTIEADESIAENEQQSEETNEEENTSEVAAEPEQPRRNRSEYKKPWVRNQAKYECTFCHELYFTKIEVEKCFNEHFDAEGLEILGSGESGEDTEEL